MKISFGKNETAWNNHGKEYETDLVRRLRPEVKYEIYFVKNLILKT